MLGSSGGRCPTDVFMLRVSCWWYAGSGGVVGWGWGWHRRAQQTQVLSLFKMGEKRFPPPFCFADLDTVLLNGLKQDSAQSKDDL